MSAGTHGLVAAAQAYGQFQPQKNYTALSPQQMVYLMDKQKQQAYTSATSTSVSSPAGAYSVSISRGPLVPGSPLHGAATVNIPSPRTPSMHSPSSISRPTSRPPSTASRPSSTASRTSSVMQGSPAGILPPSISSPRQVPIIPTTSQSQVSRLGEVDSPLDLSRPVNPQPPPQTALPRTDGNASADDPLDLSAQSSNRKRKCDDSDDDIICVGVSMPPTAGALPKIPRLAPSMLNHTGACIPSQVYQVHHAQTVTPHRLPTQYGAPHQRTAQTGTGGTGGVAARYGVTQQQQQQQQGLTQGQRTSYSSSTMMNNPYRPLSRTTSSQGKSILEEYIEAYKSGHKFPPRPTTPVSAQRPSSTHRSSPAQPPPNVPHPSSGVIKTPSQIAILQQRQEAQTTLDIQQRKRQQTKQAQKSLSGPSTTPSGTVAGQGSPLVAAPKSASVASIVQTGSMPGLPDTNSARQSNMLKQHPELHNVQIQSGRMLNHSVVQRPGVVVENRSAQSTQGAPGVPGATPTGGQAGGQQKLAGKERITYMMASEPVPACATTNATAIQITQQPTFIGAPLMVPNPALSRFNSGVQTATTTSTTTTNSVTDDMSTPGVLKTENQEEHQTNTQTANSAANGAQPQKHFTNTDTQTADLPGDQWHRPPFHRIGMPNKNIPVANVNPMPHTKCASPALHPKKQILFQTQTTNEVQGQERIPGEVKQEVPSGAETNLDPTRINQESISLKPEYSSSGDVKVDMSGHEQYISKIKERLMRRMHPDVSCDSGQDKVRHEGKGSGSSSSLKHLKRKYTRSGPGKYTAPLMKKAAQAMKREHVPYHHSSQQQQQGSPHAQAHGKPVLSKTVLDLSDITGESVDEGEHYSRIRSPHKRLGHTQLKGSQAVSKRLGIQKLKEVRLPKQQKIGIKVKEEKKEADEEYGGETEVENSEDSQVTV